MYYVIDWHNKLSIYDSTTKFMSKSVGSSLLEAITLFNREHWNTNDQPKRFILLDETLLDYGVTGTNSPTIRSIIYSFPSIDLIYLQQHHPELLI